MKETNNLEKQRFAFVLKFLKETKFIANQSAFCTSLGIRKSFFYDINRSEPVYIRIDGVLSKIKHEFPFINADWVKTGYGSIFISELLPSDKKIDYSYYIAEASKMPKNEIEEKAQNPTELYKEMRELKEKVRSMEEKLNTVLLYIQQGKK